MKEPVLVIIKPDGMSKGIMGDIFTKFDQARLDVLAMRTVKPTRDQAENHYKDLKGLPFFKDTIDYFIGKFHKRKKLLAIIYYGENAIKKLRKIAGATNPEQADPQSIRGAFGRITTKGIYENVVHVSATKEETRREIVIWFNPDDIPVKIFPTKTLAVKKAVKKVWA